MLEHKEVMQKKKGDGEEQKMRGEEEGSREKEEVPSPAL